HPGVSLRAALERTRGAVGREPHAARRTRIPGPRHQAANPHRDHGLSAGRGEPGAAGSARPTDRGRGGDRPLPPQEQQVGAHPTTLGGAVERHTHPPVATVEDGEVYWAGIDATHCKNLFLRNQKGSRHYLVILKHNKRADLRAIADQIGDGKLSFASPERLMSHLGLTPGSVSPFGLINDRQQHVRVIVDRDLKSARRVSFHPNINTVTLTLAYSDFERFLTACGNIVQYVRI